MLPVKDHVWFNGEVGLFVSSPDKLPTHLPLTVIKRMTWVDTQHVSVVLEGILPAAKALLWIGQGDTLEVLWSSCGPFDKYWAESVAMRLVDCQVKYRRINELNAITANREEPIKIEVRLACKLETVGELDATRA